jgi:hypothetical protein
VSEMAAVRDGSMRLFAFSVKDAKTTAIRGETGEPSPVRVCVCVFVCVSVGGSVCMYVCLYVYISHDATAMKDG